MLVDGGTYAASALLLFGVRAAAARKPAIADSDRQPFLTELRGGYTEVRGRRWVTMIVFATTNALVRMAGMLSVTALDTLLLGTTGAQAAGYQRPPSGRAQWYWEIDPSAPGLAGLPSTTGRYPAPGSANIWDTDLFPDSNRKGYGNEWWMNIAGFRHCAAGRNSSLTGAAGNIAAALNRRIGWCGLEGQDAIEPDDLDGYTNRGATGVRGGGWHLSRADSAFGRWLAHDAHADGLAIFQKNDAANAAADVARFDGVISEECNAHRDPCSGPGGDATPYRHAGKPVLNAEYAEDGETAAKFCSADVAAGITGALFSVDLNGMTYVPCARGPNSGQPVSSRSADDRAARVPIRTGSTGYMR